MKNSSFLIISLLAITVATTSSAYYLFTRSQISADTNNPGLPSIPGITENNSTATSTPVAPLPATPTASTTASAEIVAFGIITATPLATATPEETMAATASNSSNSTAWILIAVAVGSIAALGYIMFRKKPASENGNNVNPVNTPLPSPLFPWHRPKLLVSPSTPQQTPSPNLQSPAPAQTPPEQNINNQPPV